MSRVSLMCFRRMAVVVGLGLGIPGVALAQSPAPSPEPSPAAVPPAGRPEILKALPNAGSLTARAVQMNAGLVLEREEGAGLFPAEPSRFAFRGGSWTQSRIEIDGFDVTDPILGGRPLVWGSSALGEIGVRTDSRGTVLIHDHASSLSPGQSRFIAEGVLGRFDSSGTTADPIPSLARGHHLRDGVLAMEGVTRGGDTSWAGAISGADVSRSERDSDLERATKRLGVEGRFSHTRGDDRFQGLAMYQGHREPLRLTTKETRGSGLVFGGAWLRGSAGRNVQDADAATGARFSYLRGTAEDPVIATPLAFERLVDGPPQLQLPLKAQSQRLQAEASSHLSGVGDGLDLSGHLRWSRATSDRTLTQSVFQALESLNGTPARAWRFESSGAPARLAENLAGAGLRLRYAVRESAHLIADVDVERTTVADRDGERILSATNLLPALRFDWRKSETTRFRAEASIGRPPLPLASFEPASGHAPAMSARLWHDADGDSQLSVSELGAEVARRTPEAMSVDPNLKIPTMRRVFVELRTKFRGLAVRAAAYARRDVDLIETALIPQGGEIEATRLLPDPSGDILGASDDQVLPVIEESRASFTSSRYILTNPVGQRGLGEGVELGFEANRDRLHWGLEAAAFRDSGRGGNRGLRVDENDFGVVGESFDRTNADTYGYGRLFFDRAYSLKMFLTAADVRGFTFGSIARYDDGQPFARLVVQNDLPQGPDFVQAIPRGRARLHYTLSVDARVSRRLEFSGGAVELSASVFNALGSKFEAEEQVVWQSDYRRITMVQPPRAFVVSLRIER